MWEIEMRVLGFRTKPWGTETMLFGTPQRTPAQGGPAIEISTRLGLGGGQSQYSRRLSQKECHEDVGPE